MTTEPPVRYRTRDGDVVDEICWRYYGSRPGAAEAVLAANPGLAGRGVVLAGGLVIVLPALPAQVETLVRL